VAAASFAAAAGRVRDAAGAGVEAGDAVGDEQAVKAKAIPRSK
jgi:hypothetical protein